MSHLAEGVTYFVVFLFSTTLHEAAHAWAALRGGDATASRGGQVSLDPRPHIRREPVGMLVLPLVTALATGWPFGYASAPYDPAWAARHPRRAALMALAGPAANLLLVLAAGLLLRLGAAAGLFSAPDTVNFGHVADGPAVGPWVGASALLGAFFSVNLLLAVLNLIPLPPLDGSAIVTLGLSPESARRYQNFLWSTPALGVLGMVVAWRLCDVLFDPVFASAVNLLYPGVSYS